MATALKIRNYVTLAQAWDAEVVQDVETDERFCYVPPHTHGYPGYTEEDREVRFPERVCFGLPSESVQDELLCEVGETICLDDCCCYLGGDWNHESIEVTAKLVALEAQPCGWTVVTLAIEEV